MKPLVLISPGTINVPEDVSDTLKEVANVVYLKGDLDEHISDASALLVGSMCQPYAVTPLPQLRQRELQ